MDGRRWSAALWRDWEIWGPNGGYVDAIALRAAGAATTLPRPASFSGHFLNVAEFAAVDIDVTTLRAAKRASSLRVSPSQNGRAIFEAIVWVVVGDGPLAEETKGLARSLGVESRFRFAGWQPYERIPRYINLADVVVLPSFGEGLARVYLETQACGRVLIASDIPPAREVIDDGETGLLFPVGDVDALAACCIRAAAHPEQRARTGRAAQERARRHAIGPAVTRYLDAFETLAAKAQKRTREDAVST